MDVPSDYVLNMVRKALDDRIDSVEKKIEFNHADLKKDITELKIAIKDFKIKCDKDMEGYNHRITSLEELKYKIYAFSATIAAVSGFIWTWLLKRVS